MLPTVRLKDIARRAGVSVMTVSKSLRDERDVSAATRARIKLLAQQMGYVPDSSARGLRTRTTKFFGVVIPSSTDLVHAAILAAIEKRAFELSYDVVLAHSLNDIEREETCVRRLLSRRVDGLLIAPVYRMEPESRIYQELLARQNPPVVLLGAPAKFCTGFSSVQAEDASGSYSATQYLLKLGHRRIAFLSGPPAAPWAMERFEGYRRALRESNLDVDDRLVFKAGSTMEEGAKAASQMFDESCDATAVQAVNDLVALGCATTFLEKGLRIPENISVVGFGNTLVGEYFRVPLTTVREPKFRIGIAAMEILAQLQRGERAESRRVPCELIVRASAASPL
jgi:DNA-binding LacI/PurR family transcriptional regulator